MNPSYLLRIYGWLDLLNLPIILHHCKAQRRVRKAIRVLGITKRKQQLAAYAYLHLLDHFQKLLLRERFLQQHGISLQHSIPYKSTPIIPVLPFSPCSYSFAAYSFNVILSRGTMRALIRSPALRPSAVAVRGLAQLPLSMPQAPPPPRPRQLPWHFCA